MRMTVSDLMSPEVCKLQESKTLLDAVQLLLSNNVSQINVISDEDEFLGILPDYEILKARLSGLGWDEPVRRYVSRSVETVSVHQEIPTVMPLFREGRSETVPVIHEGLLVGELKRSVVLNMMVALDPTIQTCLPEIEDEPLLEQQCESEMKAQLSQDKTVTSANTVSSNSSQSENNVPKPYIMKQVKGIITTLNAPADQHQGPS